MQTEFYTKLRPYISFTNHVKEFANSDEVLKLIVSTANDFSNSKFVQSAVKTLSKRAHSKEEFMRLLFDFICSRVKYLADPGGHEIIYTPELLFKRGEGDCKKFTVFIASVLKAYGITPVVKAVTYKGHDWEHVYVIVKTDPGVYVTLDPVNDCKYNAEVNHKYAREYYLNGKKSDLIMNKLSQMGNKNREANLLESLSISGSEVLNNAQNLGDKFFGGSMGCSMGDTETDYYLSGMSDDISGVEDYIGMGRKHPLRDAVKHLKERVKKVFSKAKKFAFAPERAAFLGLLLLGKKLENSPLHFNLPHKLALLWAKDNGAKLSKMWIDFGGNPKVLGDTILKGSKVGMSGDEGIGIVGIAAVGGALTAALPLIVAAKKLLKEAGLLNKSEVEATDNTIQAAAEVHDDSGEHTVDTKSNDIIKDGAATGDNGSSNTSTDTPKKGFCFLTTACVEFYGMKDNCYELTTLRNFRDTYLAQPENKHLVQQYYQIAPSIVDKMRADQNKANVFANVFDKIKESCKAIEAKQYERAKSIYSDTVQQLCSAYKINF